MIECGHLRVYDLKLAILTPIHIGSGASYSKKEYMYDGNLHRVRFIDYNKFSDYLVSNGLFDRYERFILYSNDYLDSFFRECRTSVREIEEMTLYTAGAGEAITPGNSLAAINCFVRNGSGKPYVPGSSVKGAIRTALLTRLLLEHHVNNPDFKMLEPELLNTLKLNIKRQADAVNSIMRGISVSDSEPLGTDSMVLARKDDFSVQGNVKSLNVVRECIKPGTVVTLKLTLDTSVRGAPNAEDIIGSLNMTGGYYRATYLPKFKNSFPADCNIILGGGSGFFSKNIVYPALGKESVKYVSEIMCRKFKNHYHDKDVALGLSPHMLKNTAYAAKRVHIGLGRVELS